tara:strand:+ start:1682 stop:1891 length:210 start_codon:yes stop_codon:yes gene_type:complete
MSSKGEPGGNWKGKGLEVVLIVCVLAIFTTEGISFSAKSAKELGIVLLFDIEVWTFSRIKIRLNLIKFL